MLKNSGTRLVVFFATLSLLATTLVGTVNAAMVGAEAAIEAEQRAEHVPEIRHWLAQERVQNQLVALGVDPAQADERIASMTAEELRMLHERIDELPAGAGALEVIGIVFIILVILELVGVTHIFSSF